MDLRKIFYPETIAIAGLSENPLNLAGLIANNLLEWKYKGRVFGVNPTKKGMAHGAEIVPTLDDVPGEVDLLVVLAPARTIPELLDQCARKGVRHMIIETAGFSEFSADGGALGEDIRRKAREYGIRFVGPNCVGVINAENGVCLPFTHIEPWECGRVSVVSQSGGVGLSMLMLLGEHNIACNKLVSMGNKYDLDEVDYLEFLIKDECTDIILMFLESLIRGREFVEAASRTDKPILVYKGGVTEAGRKRASSHTAALANDDRVLDAALKQAGVVRVNEIQKLALYARMFSQPKMRGNKLAVISQAGGYTVIAADHAEKEGFVFPELSEETLKALTGRLRAGVIKLSNPLDLGDAFDSDTMLMSLERCLAEDTIDGVVVIQPRRPMAHYRGAFQVMMRNIVPEAGKLVEKFDKPVVFGILGLPEVTTESRGDSHLPVYHTPLESVEALAAFRDFCTRKRRRISRGVERRPEINGALASAAGGVLQGSEALRLLEKIGVRAPESASVKDWPAASAAAKRLRFPLAAKAISPELIHKTEKRGVRLGLADEAQLRAAFDELMALAAPGGGYVLLQEMVSGGVEVIVGGRRDPQFGPVVLFGTGGIMVELFEDAAMRLAPIDAEDAGELVREPKGFALLNGFRGAPPADTASLVDAIATISSFMYSHPEVEELDINPLMVLPEGRGCLAVDARLWVAE